MLTVEQITTAVTEYVSRIGAAAAADVAALYAEDGTLEDPAGGEVRTGRDNIAAFYRALDATTTTAELLTVRVSGNAAAFHMRVTTTTADRVITIDPIDVMTFDTDGLITNMRAFWSPNDVVVRELSDSAD
ncbi:nuclear transport factor 2 family protein [Nocardia sp. NPDC005366]|uniref:nuclear transport factor 2 family protein n=1 Tax=Nocardia sp. NPDC005366 TaxID=3156878 RepID=UPI0033B467D0